MVFFLVFGGSQSISFRKISACSVANLVGLSWIEAPSRFNAGLDFLYPSEDLIRTFDLDP